MRLLIVPLLALLAAGCDRQKPAQPQPEAKAAEPIGRVDISHRGEDMPAIPFLGPDGGSMKLVSGTQLVQVISNDAPLGLAMLGKCEGDEVSLQVAPIGQKFEVLRVH